MRACGAELNDDLTISANETFKIRQRIDRLHELGFAVDDFELEPTGDGSLVKMRVSVGGRTFHADRLGALTGVDASENQARVLLGDLSYHQAKRGATTSTERTLATMDWLSQAFEPLVAEIANHWPEDNPVQRYVDFLHHRLHMARERG